MSALKNRGRISHRHPPPDMLGHGPGGRLQAGTGPHRETLAGTLVWDFQAPYTSVFEPPTLLVLQLPELTLCLQLLPTLCGNVPSLAPAGWLLAPDPL